MGNHEKNNKSHHKRKDRKHKRERSIKEHKLRKAKELTEAEKQAIEESRYSIDTLQYNKLMKIFRDLLAYNSATSEEIPEVFALLDSSQEVDITDIEDGLVRESLEKIFKILSKQIQMTEDRDGRNVYSRIGARSLKEQILGYFQKARSAPVVDHISDLFGGKLKKDIEVKSVVKPQIFVQNSDEVKIRDEIQQYDQEFRPKSLMEMHLEGKNNVKDTGRTDKYLYGQKTLQKRFGSGKFINN